MTPLSKLVDYITAKEAGMSESNDLATNHAMVGVIRRRSEFQKNKSKCGWCGGPKHTQNNSDQDRQKMCKAYGKHCDKCKKANHFSSQCRSTVNKPVGAVDMITSSSNQGQDMPAESAGISGYLYGMHSREDLQQEAWATHSITATTNAMDSITGVVATLREHGPVTTLPLPHYVHDRIAGLVSYQTPNQPYCTNYSQDR